MPEKEIYDLIIIGGGPGGLSAGIYAMRAALKTALIEKGIPGGQMVMTDTVDNYPGIENISGAELSTKMAQHAQSYGLEIISREATSIDINGDIFSIKLSNGEQLDAESVILAAGGSPRKVGIPGEDECYGKGVSYCAVCDGFFFRGKTVAVVGGGDSAVEEAHYLSKLAKKTYIIHRRDELRAGKILQQRVFAESSIEVIWNKIPIEIKADDSGVVAMDLEDTQTGEVSELATDGVFIFIGFKPNNDLVPAEVNMNPGGYVITNEKCETNVPGFFVVGDLRDKFARQIVISASEGCIAALSAAWFVENKRVC